MQRSDFKLHQKVFFGRPNGEKTLGQIVKLNPTKAKVKTLETRGNDRPVGQVWSVPYNLLTPAPADVKAGDPPPPRAKATLEPLFDLPPVPGDPPLNKVPYSPFGEDNDLLDCLLNVYSGLSPENLSGDGEIPRPQVQRRAAILDRKRRGLLIALGRNVTEDELYEWDRSRREFQKTHEQRRQA